MEEETDVLWAEIAAMLRSDQVTDLQIAAYKSLVLRGSAAPSTVAKATGQSRGRIYQILRALVGRGLARQLPGRPSRFSAVPLQDVLIDLSAASRRRTDLLERGLAESVDKRPAVGPPKELTTASDVHLIDGRRAWTAEVRRALLRARQTFALGGPGQLGKRLAKSYPLLGEIRAAAERGVEVTIFASRGPGEDEDFKFLERQLEPASVRAIDAPAQIPLVFVATDDTALSTLIQPDDARIDRGSDLGLLMRGPNAATATRLLLGALAAGPSRSGLQAHPLRWLDAMIRSARRAVSFVGAFWWKNPDDAEWLVRSLEATTEQGIQLRVLMDQGATFPKSLPSIGYVDFPLTNIAMIDDSVILPGNAQGGVPDVLLAKPDQDALDTWSRYVAEAWALSKRQRTLAASGSEPQSPPLLERRTPH